MAEDMRFELTEAFTSPPFQDGALNHSANPPIKNKISEPEINLNGARGRTRTVMVLLPVDFESTASTDFTTRAFARYIIYFFY